MDVKEEPIATIEVLRAEWIQAVNALIDKISTRTSKIHEAALKFVRREARFPCPFGNPTNGGCECAPHRARALLDEMSPRWAEYDRES